MRLYSSNVAVFMQKYPFVEPYCLNLVKKNAEIAKIYLRKFAEIMQGREYLNLFRVIIKLSFLENSICIITDGVLVYWIKYSDNNTLISFFRIPIWHLCKRS